ncbi:hypothetical protein KR222_009245, partial [Zaprionus bogoriensis]
LYCFISSGPGPGAYGLPPTIGYERHDNRKRRLPQYSMAARLNGLAADPGPGPGAYQLGKLTRYGQGTSPEYTIAALT